MFITPHLWKFRRTDANRVGITSTYLPCLPTGKCNLELTRRYSKPIGFELGLPAISIQHASPFDAEELAAMRANIRHLLEAEYFDEISNPYA